MGKLINPHRNQEYTLNDILIDTGSDAYMIINATLVDRFELPTFKLSSPYKPILADATPSQDRITLSTQPLHLTLTDKRNKKFKSIHPNSKLLVFPITHDIILGLPWCQEVCPEIDWSTLSLSLPNNIINISQVSVNNNSNPTLETYDKIYSKSTLKLNSRGIPAEYMDYSDVFKEKNDLPAPLPPHRPYVMSISLDPNNPLPPSPKIYPLAPAHEKILKEYIDRALAKGWISPSKAEYAEPIFIVPKPNNEGRCCINYKNTNQRTKKISYPIPLVQELIDQLGKAAVFTRLDLPDAYHLVRIKEGDEHKTAFRCKFGLFQYNVVSFGLNNALPVFQFFLDDIFKDELRVFVIIYFDDFLIYSEDPTQHEAHVKAVLQKLRKNNLVVNPAKCSFHVNKVDFLGYMVTVMILIPSYTANVKP